jgi:hypothetical protein
MHYLIANPPAVPFKFELDWTAAVLSSQWKHGHNFPETRFLPAKRSSIGRSKLAAPVSDCHAQNSNAPLSKQVFDIAEAECERMIESTGVTDDITAKPMPL